MSDRYVRQQAVVDAKILGNLNVQVVGCGAIGSQIALYLASMGVPRIILWDFDKVEEVNLSSQGWRESDIGKSKVAAITERMSALNSEIKVYGYDSRFKRDFSSAVSPDSYAKGNLWITFACVDTMEGRNLIYESVRSKRGLLIDGRMSAELIRVLCVNVPDDDDKWYPGTLTSDADAYQGACTSRSLIYTTGVAAGIMVSCMTKYMRSIPLSKDKYVNILSEEWFEGEASDARS